MILLKYTSQYPFFLTQNTIVFVVYYTIMLSIFYLNCISTLQDQLDYLKHAFLLGLVALYERFDVQAADTLHAYIQRKHTNHHKIQLLIHDAQKQFSDTTNQLVRQYMTFLTRSFIIELYELCKSSDDFVSLKKQMWFVFLANLRHAYAHGIQWYWRIAYYGRSYVTYTRQSDLRMFELNPQRDGLPVRDDQYGGLATIWDLTHYVETFVIERGKKVADSKRFKVSHV